MTFSEGIEKSVNDYIALVELDIGIPNTEWVNIGAGIWCFDVNGLYSSWVDSSLLQGFYSHPYINISYAIVDGIYYGPESTLLLASENPGTVFYDATNKILYIHTIDNNDIHLSTAIVGSVYGFSYKEFIPIGSDILYEGRLKNDIEIYASRDLLYFGKIQYSTGSIELANEDGFFDTFTSENDMYGNEVRFYTGFASIDRSDYELIHSATIEQVIVSENSLSVYFSDKRKSLTKSASYTATAMNALEAIRDILLDNYNITYDSNNYDTTAWAAAEAISPNISVDIQTGKSTEDSPVIEMIENICSSIFGLFIIKPDGKYSFKIVDIAASASTTIYSYDIMNRHSIAFDPTEVISSAKIGYNKDWAPGYVSPYDFYTNASYESDVFTKYKVYNQKTFYTWLVDLASATAFSETIMNYVKDIHGIGHIQTPMAHWVTEIGDIVDIEINRENSTMFGTKKCEIISKAYLLRDGFINFGYRIIS